MFRYRLLTITLCLALLLGSAISTSPARAGVLITVNTTLDNTTDDGFCSLREAIINANSDAVPSDDDCGQGFSDDGINFANTLGTATILLSSALPPITDVEGLSIIGGGDITIDGTYFYRVFTVNSGALLTLDSLTVQHGGTVAQGGGAYNSGTLNISSSTFYENRHETLKGAGVYNNGGALTISNSTFSSNVTDDATGGEGGGVYSSGGTLTITGSTFNNNDAFDKGGGVYIAGGLANVTNSTFAENGDAFIYGAGIYNAGGTLTVTKSTFFDNSSNTGGGIYNAAGSATVANSTFTANGSSLVAGSTMGSGIFTLSTLTVRNSTFSGNKSSASAAAGIANNGGTVTLFNNILANSTSGKDCANYAGTVTGSNNLIETDDTVSACGTTAPLASDPNLGALTGSPAYFPLLSGSPAISAGDDTICTTTPVSSTSQNDVGRPQGAHCEIGSFEVPSAGPGAPVVSSINRASADPSSALSVNFTVTFSEAVTGVDAGDFSLTTSGVTGASITGVGGSGATRTVSVNTGSGNGTIRLDLVDNDSIANGSATQLGGAGLGNGNYSAGQVYTINKVLTVLSAGANDGWILESGEATNAGGSMNNALTTFQLGDNALNRQYRAILSFNTAALPDGATLSSAVLKIHQSGAPVGSNPFAILGNLWTDIRKGSFGAAGLELADFNSAASANTVGFFNPTPVSGWYSATLNGTGRTNINKTGLTQIRLRFNMDDNNDLGADYMKFISGNALSNQPTLVITYTAP